MEVPAKFGSVLTGFRYWLLALVFMATSMLLISCGSGGTTIDESVGGGGVSGGGAIIFNPLDYLANVETGKTTDITANVTQLVTVTEVDGTTRTGTLPVAGVTVTFSFTDNPSQGLLSAGSAVTNVSGKATVTYTAGDTDTVTDIATARIEGVGFQDANITVNPTGIGTIAIAVNAAPTILEAVDATLYPIPETITTQSIISATASVGGANLVGEDIGFSATGGTLCDYPNCTAPASTAQTDANGVARIILQSTDNLGTATVKAQYQTESATTAVTFIAGPAYDFTLFASPVNMTADGSSTSTVTVVARDASGHIVADGTSVDFSLKTSSTGSGDFVEIPPTASTSSGVATVTFKAGTTSGVIDIRASSGGVNSDDSVATYGDSLITLIQEFVGDVTLSLDTSTLAANGTDFTVATATLLNTGGLPVNPDTPVTFSTTGGDLDNDTNPATNPLDTNPDFPTVYTVGDLGQASVFLRSETITGQYFVTATSGSKSAVVPVIFEALAANAGNSTLDVSPTSISAGGFTATITLAAKDVNGNPVTAGKTVGFSVESGGGVISNQTTTDSSGVATATITSSSTPGTYDLSAVIDGVTVNTTSDATPVQTQITYVSGVAGGNPNTIELDLNDTYLALESPSGSDAIEITATVLDIGGNPVADCTSNITFSIDSGPNDIYLDGKIQTGPEDFITKGTTGGVVSALLTAGSKPGTVRVQVSAIQGSTCTAITPVSVLSTAITIASGQAASLFIYPDPAVTDNGDGSISRIMNALVTDKYGNPVVNGTVVYFGLDDDNNPATDPVGQEVCPSGVTGTATDETTSCVGSTSAQEGIARTKLTWSSTLVWTDYYLSAETSGGDVNNLPVSVRQYPPVPDPNIEVTIIPPSVPAGTTGIDVIALYRDGADNPINGITLDFTTSSGLVTVNNPTPATETTDLDGYASTIVDTAQCSDDVTVTITVADTPYFGDADLTIQGTKPTASFTVTDNGGGSFTFTNTSTEPGGYTYTYDWSFGDATPNSSVESPTHNYADPGTYIVSLTVTGPASVGSCSDIANDSVTW